MADSQAVRRQRGESQEQRLFYCDFDTRAADCRITLICLYEYTGPLRIPSGTGIFTMDPWVMCGGGGRPLFSLCLGFDVDLRRLTAPRVVLVGCALHQCVSGFDR